MYFVYILTCADTTLYVGSTNDMEKRLHAHNHLKSGLIIQKSDDPLFCHIKKVCVDYATARAREAERSSA
jgi:predicted GIY-YIG superfamily endonuclease